MSIPFNFLGDTGMTGPPGPPGNMMNVDELTKALSAGILKYSYFAIIN